MGELDGVGGRGRVLGQAPRFQMQIRFRYSNEIVRHVHVEALAGTAMVAKT
ncbi:hypothetical protein ACRAWG_28760 [Methylobacterium sp. P31]